MYHTSQVELHGPTRSTTSTSSDSAPFDTDPAASPSGQSTGSPTHKADPENGRASSTAEIEPYSYGTVYDIPDDMDPDDPDLELVGLVLSPECGLALAFNASSVHLERYFRQVVRYSIAITAITIAEVRGVDANCHVRLACLWVHIGVPVPKGSSISFASPAWQSPPSPSTGARDGQHEARPVFGLVVVRHVGI